ncbi:hypothetical protein KM043_003917 [Ampulex compressa]|nr:hypothetical protein KM043_003917 [Ampulex compressa]
MPAQLSVGSVCRTVPHGSRENRADKMATVQPLQKNGIIIGFMDNEKKLDEVYSRYATPSESGFDGPNQVLSTDVDTTTEISGCVRIKLDKDGINSTIPISIPGLLMTVAKSYPDHIALVTRAGVDGQRTMFTYKEYETKVRTVAKAFLKLGLERFHSVCILGFNSPEWFISDLAAIYAGGVAVGIYTTNSAEACQYCAESSQANIIVVEDGKQLQKILQIKDKLPCLKAIVQYDGIPTEKDVLSWQELLEIGEKESEDQLELILKTIGTNQCCTLVYTSGTVGPPKAVMLSHDNLLHDARTLAHAHSFSLCKEVVVSYLPLSHVAAQLIDLYACLCIVGTIYFADKNALKGSLVDTLISARPTTFVGIPRVWEKIYEKMQAVGRNNGTIKNWIATWAKSQGLYYHMNKMNGIDYKSWGYIVAKWLIFNKVKAALGLDRCNLLVTAAAPLSAEIKKYFMSLDMCIMEAYGMSESSGAHIFTRCEHYRLDSIGRTLVGFKTKLDNIDDNGEGEICMSGRHIFMGYLNDPEKTAEAKDQNGWLHSGDLGRVDSDGFYYITGRKKELIITAGGENIPPVHVEHLVLSELPVLSNAFLIGDQRRYLTILLTLKTDMNAETGQPLDSLSVDTLNWAMSIGSNSKTVTDVLSTHDPLIYKEIENAIKRANDRAISNAQKVQKFRLLPHDFSVPTGELGPTLKMKFALLLQRIGN